MLSINRVMITGRLTRDPETKYLASGMAVTSLSVAVNRRFQDRNNEWREETTFLDIETWGKTAERCAENLRKGRPVYIEGRLKSDTWEREGQKQTKLKIVADRVSAFDVPARGESTGNEMGAESESAGSSRSTGSGWNTGQTGAPSDALDFQSNVEDDIPF